MILRTMILGLAVVVALGGCASSKSSNVYTRNQTRGEMTVRLGVVESIREVTMEGTKSGVGSLAGAAVGGVAGSNLGGGKGQIVGAIVGAVVGDYHDTAGRRFDRADINEGFWGERRQLRP